MRVLVTGGGGFLGSHVIAILRQRGHEPVALVRPGRARPWLAESGVETVDGDLTDEASLRRALRGVDGLVHAAARTGYWSRIAAEQRAVNVEGTSGLYRAAQSAGTARIVHVSSIGTLGCDRVGKLLDENATFNARALKIEYVTTKHESEQRALAAAWAGMPVVVVNPGALLGPRYDGRPPSTLITRIRDGRTRWIPPGGTSVCDVEDVAAGVVEALVRGKSGERYILGGHNRSWAELYADVARVLGVRAPTLRVPRAALPLFVGGARALDLVGLSRPPWTPEIFRAWGWHCAVDSRKAERELDYRVRPLDEILARAAGALVTPRLRTGTDP